jgi:hypothetical protein
MVTTAMARPFVVRRESLAVRTGCAASRGEDRCSGCRRRPVGRRPWHHAAGRHRAPPEDRVRKTVAHAAAPVRAARRTTSGGLRARRREAGNGSVLWCAMSCAGRMRRQVYRIAGLRRRRRRRPDAVHPHPTTGRRPQGGSGRARSPGRRGTLAR